MKVKVCGMRDAHNIAEIAALHPDYMGFIFYKPSPRNCIGIDADIIALLPADIEPVMVSVDMNEEEILEIAKKYGFHTVQLHGNESPELCTQLKNSGMKVFKAMGVQSAESITQLRKYEGKVDYFLLDTHTPSKGGSGKKFDWGLLDYYDLDTPFILSGGISLEDAEAILELRHPKFEGIDLNSRFESAPGIKNANLLHNFFLQIKK